MTRETYIKLKPILDAWVEGKQIQVKIAGSWIALPDDPSFSLMVENYRIKPEPREFWINVYKPALGEDGPIDNITIYPTKMEADRGAHSSRLECIKVKEVLD